MPATAILDYLRALAPPDPVCYQPNPGNAGDSLIAAATFQLFRKAAMPYEVTDWATADLRGRVCVYGGGGILVPQYQLGHGLVARALPAAARVIILPHTIAGCDELLGACGPQVDILCREEVSYRYVRQRATRANVLLMEDLALGLDMADALRPPTPPSRGQACWLALRHGWQQAGRRRHLQLPLVLLLAKPRLLSFYWRHRRFSPGTLNAFRLDAGRTDIPVPRDNLDVSELFAYGTEPESLARYAAFRLLSFLQSFHTVRTNRLHVAIGAALLGLTVDFYPNNNFKCQAVYEYSLKERFPAVRWMGPA